MKSSISFKNKAKTLHEHCALGNLKEIQSALIRNPRLINLRNLADFTPLEMAVTNGRKNVATVLLGLGAVIDLEDSSVTAMHYACENGHFEIVKLLHSKGANINAYDEDIGSPIILAVRGRHKEIVEYLTINGADLDMQDKVGSTALLYACLLNSPATVNLLLNHKAHTNIRDNTRFTALMWTCMKGYVDILRTLIDHHASIDTTNEYLWTPLMISIMNGHYHIAFELIKRGASINSRSRNGSTPFLFACKEGNFSLAKHLIELGCDYKVESFDGEKGLELDVYGVNCVPKLCKATRQEHVNMLHAIILEISKRKVIDYKNLQYLKLKQLGTPTPKKTVTVADKLASGLAPADWIDTFSSLLTSVNQTVTVGNRDGDSVSRIEEEGIVEEGIVEDEQEREEEVVVIEDIEDSIIDYLQ